MGFCVPPKYRWSQGIIPFQFDKSLSTEVRQLIDRAMVRWQKKVNAGGRTVPYVLMMSGGSGSTIADSVGTFDLGKGTHAEFKIAENAAGYGAIPHELGHTIGLAHEHDHPDSNHVPDPKSPRHWMILDSQKLSYSRYVVHGAYDPASIMHYKNAPGYVWKKNASGGTQPTYADVRTDNWTPSAGDIATVRALYAGEVSGTVTAPISLTQPFAASPVDFWKGV